MALNRLQPVSLSWLDPLILLGAIALFFLGLGDFPLYEPHEGHFAGVAREMMLRGDWLTPHLNGAPYLNKPPLLYWAIALSYSTFGINEFAARLPLALGGIWGVFMVWQWGRDLGSAATGRVAALMLASACGWFIFSHQLLIDLLLSSLLMTAYYCLWKLVLFPRNWLYGLGFWGLLGLIVLAKGPFMLVFPVIALLVMSLIYSPGRIWQGLTPSLGIPLFLLLIVPWAIAIERANPGFWQYFIANENLERLADRRYPPDYAVSQISALGYLGMTLVWALPWSLVLPQTLVHTWVSLQQSRQEQASGLMLLAMTALLPVLLFLPISSRLIYYSLPSLPPLILLTALWWTGGQARRGVAMAGGRTLAAVTLMAAGVAVVLARWQLLDQLEVDLGQMEFLAWPIALSFGIGALLAGGLLLRRQPLPGWLTLVLGMAIAYYFIIQGFSAFAEIRSSQPLISQAEAELPESTLWVFEGSRELGAAGAMSFYLNPDGERFPEFPTLDDGWVWGQGDRAYRIVYVLSDAGESRSLPIFPGPSPRYQISDAELQAFWQSDRPVVFVTDFLRDPNDPNDPLTRNLPDNAGDPLLVIGPRYLYGNPAAR
ncbi:glycosyltransferase family 39 protein [Phormidium yuhuli AB48]|uniref:Glycosyltransferase family 39 protein n=1 Tax=Phormidium yuhuli AB48 TaxID=2940671 RepID=A0ABY5AME5_9CYAN|nr:glycosyltransferase family 39 protein [Phormidium yuhuli]USR90387.1 glycosyltransferase family 39 protein [Phormidium yuhuli AB48]